MTSVTAPADMAGSKNQGWFARNHIGLHTVLGILMFIWLVPTVGLLVTSVRPGTEAAASGWWTALFPPFKFTFENYSHVLGQSDIATNFIQVRYQYDPVKSSRTVTIYQVVAAVGSTLSIRGKPFFSEVEPSPNFITG